MFGRIPGPSVTALWGAVEPALLRGRRPAREAPHPGAGLRESGAGFDRSGELCACSGGLCGGPHLEVRLPAGEGAAPEASVRVCSVVALWGRMGVAHRAPLSMRFSRQEQGSGLPLDPPGNLPNPGIETAALRLLHWRTDSLTPAPPGKPPETRVPATLLNLPLLMCVLVAQSCPTLRPHGLKAVKLLCPWSFHGKHIGVGCHFLLPNPEVEPRSPAFRAYSLLSEAPTND